LGEDIALIQMAQAGARVTNELQKPENLIPVSQPSHSPELKPIERVWEYIKQQLVGEVFTTLGQLRERLKQVLEKITPQPTCSLSSYNFILEALFYSNPKSLVNLLLPPRCLGEGWGGVKNLRLLQELLYAASY
jgi:hypothetical protein